MPPHKLLAASASRATAVAGGAAPYIGVSLWRYAGPEILEAEASLADGGWFERPFLAFVRLILKRFAWFSDVRTPQRQGGRELERSRVVSSSATSVMAAARDVLTHKLSSVRRNDSLAASLESYATALFGATSRIQHIIGPSSSDRLPLSHIEQMEQVLTPQCVSCS